MYSILACMAELPSDPKLLQEFTEWLFSKDGEHDPAEDNKRGQIVREQNQARNAPYWFLPGSWGAIRLNPRDIKVKSGTTLVCLVATSHATRLELKENEQSLSEDEMARRLTALAKDVDGLWLNPHLTIIHNGTVQEIKDDQLSTATTPMFKTNIHPKNGYARIIRKDGNDIPTVTIGHFHKFTPGDGTTKIVIAAQARPDDDIGLKEPEYNVQVAYNITTEP
jgi:hypothetical protein